MTTTPIAAAIERTTMTAPMNAEPTRPPSPIEDAFAYAAAGLDRLELVINSLEQTAHRLGTRLVPVLTDGNYGRPDAGSDAMTEDPTPEDRRSTIARRVSGHAERADRLADHGAHVQRLLEDLTEALEV